MHPLIARMLTRIRTRPDRSLTPAEMVGYAAEVSATIGRPPRWLQSMWRRRPPTGIHDPEEVDVPTFEIVYPYPQLILKTYDVSFVWGPKMHQVWYCYRGMVWNLMNVARMWLKHRKSPG